MKLISAEAFLKHTQTPGTRHEIDDIIAPVLFLQNVFAHQVLDPNWSWRKNALKLISVIVLVSYVISGTIDCMQTTDNFNLFAEAIFTLIIIYQFASLNLFFVFYRFTFREVYVMAKVSIFSIIEEISPERSIRLVSLFRKMIKAVFFLILSPMLYYLCTALWFYVNGVRVPLSPSTSTLMPMSSPTYEVGLVLHTVFFLMVASGSVIVNLWFILLTWFFCEACDCAVKTLEISKDDKTSCGDTYAKRLNEALAKFYSVHVKLMKYLNKLNAMYKWPILVPILAGLMLTCVFFLVTSEKVNWRLGIVILIDFVVISSFNLLGEHIKTKIEEMNKALQNFNWLDMRVQDRRNYCIITCFMNRKVGMRTALGADLSLVTLSSIYKGSYQAYAVFNTMKN